MWRRMKEKRKYDWRCPNPLGCMREASAFCFLSFFSKKWTKLSVYQLFHIPFARRAQVVVSATLNFTWSVLYHRWDVHWSNMNVGNKKLLFHLFSVHPLVITFPRRSSYKFNESIQHQIIRNRVVKYLILFSCRITSLLLFHYFIFNRISIGKYSHNYSIAITVYWNWRDACAPVARLQEGERRQQMLRNFILRLQHQWIWVSAQCFLLKKAVRRKGLWAVYLQNSQFHQWRDLLSPHPHFI